MKLNKSNSSKIKKIKFVLTDVDGVLTDGSRYYSEKGEEIKKFHVHDGMGVNLLLRNGIKSIIITKENSKIVKKWATEMNFAEILMNIKTKENELEKIIKKYHCASSEIAYIGDDVNDVDLLKNVGFSASPHNAIQLVKNSVDYICKTDSGKGAFRELCDLLLTTQFPKKKKWY